MLSNTLRLGFCYLKILHILHLHYHPKIIEHILKNKQQNKCVCIHEVIPFINRNENEDENDKHIKVLLIKTRVFQKALFCTLVSNTNLVLNVLQIAAAV